MNTPIVMGAVAYAPRVKQIWQGFKDYFESRGFAYDYVLFDNYGDLVASLLDGAVHMTWNSPLSWVATRHFGAERGLEIRGLAMRDTDLDVRSTLVARKASGIRTLADVAGKAMAFDAPFAPESTLLPLEYLARHGLLDGRDFQRVTIDKPAGSSGGYAPDSTLRRIAAMISGEVDACWLRSDHHALFQQHDPAAPDCVTVATIDPYDHCIFAAIRGREHPATADFVARLLDMSYDDPAVRPLFDLEELKRWHPARDTGYAALTEATRMFGFPDSITGPCRRNGSRGHSENV